MAPDWAAALAPVEPAIRAAGDFLRAEVAAGRTYLPAGDAILNAFRRPLTDVRVLVVGQDPYPTPGHPIGLSFAVDPHVRPTRMGVEALVLREPGVEGRPRQRVRTAHRLDRRLRVPLGRPRQHTVAHHDVEHLAGAEHLGPRAVARGTQLRLQVGRREEVLGVVGVLPDQQRCDRVDDEVARAEGAGPGLSRLDRSRGDRERVLDDVGHGGCLSPWLATVLDALCVGKPINRRECSIAQHASFPPWPAQAPAQLEHLADAQRTPAVES